MNTETGLFKDACKAVRGSAGIDLRQEPLSSRQGEGDGVAVIKRGKHAFRRPYTVRKTLDAGTIHMVSLLRKESGKGLLLVSPHVNERQAAQLRRADVFFVDTAGNAFVEEPGLLVWVTGRRVPKTNKNGSTSRAFHASGLKLVFALLADPALDADDRDSALINKTYREIGAATGLSHSTVGWVMPDLLRQGFVVDMGHGQRMLADRKRLMEHWMHGYATRLRPRMVQARYQPATMDWWKTAMLDQALWSGEVAAAKMTRQLKPGTATLFGEPLSHEFILNHGLQKDPKGTVECVKPFLPLCRLSAKSDSDCVHPLLVFADLVFVDDDRTREIAQIVYDNHLRSTIETA